MVWWRLGRSSYLVLAAVAVLAAVVGVPAGEDRGTLAVAAEVSAATADTSGPPGVLPAGGSWSVTLLTGDVVEAFADADGRVSATVREHTRPFHTLREPDGDLYVVPVSVTPLLAADLLDLELFDVTGLIRQGYDDDATEVVPLIVEVVPGADVQSALGTAPTVRPLPSIGAVATEVPKADTEATGALLAELGADVGVHTESVAGITRVWLDGRVSTRSVDHAGRWAPVPPTLDGNLTQVGADDAWAAGFTGAGVRVAVLDTGVDARHPDLVDQVVVQENFSPSPDIVDRVGHGTHVASLVAGTGAASHGSRRGVAPDADLLIGKVLGDNGFGQESEIIAGMEWAAPQADVVNMSLGSDFRTDGSDPLSMAVDRLSEQHGTLFVIAAGNSGPASQTVGSPGAADSALTVGAVDAADVVAEFSSRGPLVDSNELKPEVVAPGVDIVAARASGTAMGEPVDGDYTTASGTSMATPHVAGAAAVLAQEHPDWNGEQLKDMLIGSSDPTGADGFDAGAGRIDIGDGVLATVRAERDVVDVALGHPRTEPHTETLTWTNTSAQPVVVTLDAALADRRGETVDEVSVEPARLTIPAHGTGTAALTIDAAGLDSGLYSGAVTAELPDAGGTDPDQLDLRTPIGVHADPEMATITVEATPPEQTGGGEAVPIGAVTIVNLDDAAIFAKLDFYLGSSYTVAVPLGRYAVVGTTSRWDPDHQAVAQVGDPDVSVTGDTTVAFDGAAAVPLQPTVTGVDSIPVATNVGMLITPDAGTGGFPLVTEAYSWYPSPPVLVTPMEGDPDNFAFRDSVLRLQAPPVTATAGGQPIDVSLAAFHAGMPDEGRRTLTAVDAGDGSDLSAARDKLALVQLPVDPTERSAVTQRALDAGVAVLAFVDEQRTLLTPTETVPWADVPVITAAGSAAGALRAAAQAGQPVTLTVTASPFVYDLVLPADDRIDPEPVIDRAEQARLATLHERFHRDPDGTGATLDRRRALSVSSFPMELDSVGPLPQRRVAHVTPGVTWGSYVIGDGFFGLPIPGYPPNPAPVAFSISADTSYAPRSHQTVTWLKRPMAPGPVGGPRFNNFCQPPPVTRDTEVLHVVIERFQDHRDGFGCNFPLTSSMTLERDGAPLATVPFFIADFDIPPEAGDYRLTYEQSGFSPYPHRSTTTWSFRSAADPVEDSVPVPLLVVDYDLPLDTLNRPTGDIATFTVHQVTGAPQHPIRSLRVWTSTDDGATWQRASAQRRGDGVYRVTLPEVDSGRSVSLRVDAQDVQGNRIEQTLLDAYRA